MFVYFLFKPRCFQWIVLLFQLHVLLGIIWVLTKKQIFLFICINRGFLRPCSVKDWAGDHLVILFFWHYGSGCHKFGRVNLGSATTLVVFLVAAFYSRRDCQRQYNRCFYSPCTSISLFTNIYYSWHNDLFLDVYSLLIFLF